MCISLVADLGGIVGLSEESAALVRSAAAMTIRAEGLQVALVRGEAVDLEQLTRLTNGLTRLLNAIKSRRNPKTKTPTIHEIAARHRKGSAGAQ